MPKTVEEIRRELAQKPLTRSLYIERAEVDAADDRTINLAFASDTPIEHWSWELWDAFELALSMDKKAMRTERLESGAPLLMDHNTQDQIGVIESFEIDKKSGRARANVRFSRSTRGEEIFQDVKDGIRKSVSVGFMIWEMHLEEERKDKPNLYRSDDWEPYEISIVSVPADISVGVGRSGDPSQKINIEVSVTPSPSERALSTKTENTMTPEEIAAAKAAEAQRTAAPAPVVERSAAEIAREIVEFADIFKQGDLARSMIAASDQVTLDDVRVAIRSAQPTTVKGPTETAEEIAARNGGKVDLARVMPRHGAIKSFKGERAAEAAFRFGQWLLAGPLGDPKAKRYCEEHGITLRTMNETVNEKGGFLVPDEFGNDLIDLREIYGVFRRNAKIVPMASDTRSDPRRTGGLTAYFVAESAAGTYSDLSWDRVQLVAKKLMVLTRYSSEVNEDSVIDFGDTIASEIAYAFAQKEDDCGFNGDGTSTYGGIVGVIPTILGLSATRANIAGLQVGTGNLFSEIVVGDFEGLLGRLPVYADGPNAKWYMHKSVYWNVAARLVLANAGAASDVEDRRNQKLLGYDVEFVQVMPRVDGNDQVLALFGDLSLAASFGSRRDTTISVSEHSRFANDEIEMKGTERFDINVHDVGNESATAADRVAGPMVALVSAAS